MNATGISRRDFLRLSSLSGGALLLVACGANVPEGAVLRTDEDEVMVGDVLSYALSSDTWAGGYGWVRFRLREGRHNGEPIYFIRTDTSNAAFADAEKLVHVPLLNNAADIATNIYYNFDDDRLPVLLYAPTDEGFSSCFKMVTVTGDGDFTSAEQIEAAAASGALTLSEDNIYVNYPLVQWAGGALPVDEVLEETLGGGPLTAPIDIRGMTVTFKLHKCYPGSRYIVTDTSAVPMAPMMGIIGSAPTQALKEAGATDEIWVFANGLVGPGAMGFQPAVFDNKAGEPAWSPFWDHLTVRWTDESKARLLTTSAEIRELVASGELEQFNGVPDSHPNGFVVNCPAPILSPNDYQPA